MAITYKAIASVTVGSGGAANIEFTSIPGTYTDLKVVASTRTIATSDFLNVRVRFNSDTASNYKWRRIYGDGTNAASDNNTSDTGNIVGLTPGSAQTASTFSNFEFYIPNYTSSNQKSVSLDGVGENNATTAYASLTAGLWTGTNAITSITIYASVNMAQYSTATLYGILKA
jgi:hypothetical protein